MDIEWGGVKRLSNHEKHGVWFEDAMYIFEGVTVTWPDRRNYSGEVRFISFGIVDGRLLAVVHTWRGEVCRIISARKANKREQRAYHAALSEHAQEPDG